MGEGSALGHRLINARAETAHGRPAFSGALVKALKAAPNRPYTGGRSRPRGVRSAFTPTLIPAYQKLADNVHDSPREHRRWVTRIGRAAAPETPSSGRVP